MKAIRFICLVHLMLISSEMLFGATLVSQVDARRTGGTSTGTFVAGALPSFLLVPTSGTFGIQNSGTHPAGSWQFAVGVGGLAVIQPTATINLTQISSFSSARIAIDASGIGFSADRFNPSNRGYLFAMLGEDYYAFEVAKWSTNNNSNSNGDRVRFYGAMPAEFAPLTSTITVVPEPSALIMSCMGAFALSFRRRS